MTTQLTGQPAVLPRGRIGKVPAMVGAFGLIVLIITISVTTWSHGSKPRP